MMIWHRHEYEDVGTDYIEPVDVDNAYGSGTELMKFFQKISAGYTVIQQRCECGKYRTQEVLGRLTP